MPGGSRLIGKLVAAPSAATPISTRAESHQWSSPLAPVVSTSQLPMTMPMTVAMTVNSVNRPLAFEINSGFRISGMLPARAGEKSAAKVAVGDVADPDDVLDR